MCATVGSASNPTGLALAFRQHGSLGGFFQSWGPTIGALPAGRVRVVQVALPAGATAVGLGAEQLAAECEGLEGWQADYVALGRVAIRATGCREVVSMGGGQIAAQEARAGIADGISWIVYAASRGQKEEQPTLCDFVLSQQQPQEGGGEGDHQQGLFTLVRGRDPNEDDVFTRSRV
jgi:hypothetical protein